MKNDTYGIVIYNDGSSSDYPIGTIVKAIGVDALFPERKYWINVHNYTSVYHGDLVTCGMRQSFFDHEIKRLSIDEKKLSEIIKLFKLLFN